MKRIIILLIALCALPFLRAQTCDSSAAAEYGGWKAMESAPKDGTTVELLNTYGLAPTYGLAKWTREQVSHGENNTLVTSTSGLVASTSGPPSWTSVDNPGMGYMQSPCLLWRPYKGDPKHYVDPTGGAQNTIAYWCTYIHRPYNKKKDACE